MSGGYVYIDEYGSIRMPRPKFTDGNIVLYEELNTLESLLDRLPDQCTTQQLASRILIAKRSLASGDRSYAKQMIDVIRESMIDAFDMM